MEPLATRELLSTSFEEYVCEFDLIGAVKMFYYFFLMQDEKNQVLTTNIWLRMVRIHERLSVLIFFLYCYDGLGWISV